MSSLIDVAPYDGGWCVKIIDTGEVMFFAARRRAISAAHELTRRWPATAKVRIRGRSAPARESATWLRDDVTTSFSYPLGVPA